MTARRSRHLKISGHYGRLASGSQPKFQMPCREGNTQHDSALGEALRTVRAPMAGASIFLATPKNKKPPGGRPGRQCSGWEPTGILVGGIGIEPTTSTMST